MVPATSIEVSVIGEVLNSSSFVYSDDYSFQDYLSLAGGLSKYADKRAIYVIRSNGQSEIIGRNIFGGYGQIYPGDTIVVPRDLEKLDTLPLISVATKIISDIAFSAASLNAIQN